VATKRANAFRAQLMRNHALAEAIGEPAFPMAAFETLQDWQRHRLMRTYEDFMARDSDAPACHFFLEELYGGMNFRERDQQVARVEPVMSRTLPRRALHALAEALRLQAISLEFDMDMANVMRLRDLKCLSTETYASVYRECGRKRDREDQILLIRSLGHELERLIKMPLLLRLLHMLGGPARAAGFGRLQAFLENGLHSFSLLRNPAEFVESIYNREWQAMNRLFSGHTTPFAYPLS